MPRNGSAKKIHNPEFQDLKAQFAKAKAKRDDEEARGLKDTRDAKQRQTEWNWRQASVMGWLGIIIVTQILGLYLFTSGFLLTRFILSSTSTCGTPPIDLASDQALGTIETGCWHPRRFSRAVIIIIDALRYDFAVPYAWQRGHDRPIPGSRDGSPSHYHDAFPILFDVATQKPDHAFLTPFIADPPTSTVQRLKGLTTGTLPTFVDIGRSFAGTTIDEDNLIAQLRHFDKTVVQLGDDTWHALFPEHLDKNLSRAYDSFNVWDLHTVDNGVIEHLAPLLAPENVTRWDLLVGHLLGVDHAGHRYGPNHPAMTEKLNQMDSFIASIIEKIGDDTLLVVMGDHGMDSKGDHGGESQDEVTSALWMYSKKPFFGRRSAQNTMPPRNAERRFVPQIDLVPTLALLLGLPVPFNNLGRPIYEAFVGPDGRNFENLARALRVTSAQVSRYMTEYLTHQAVDEVIPQMPDINQFRTRRTELEWLEMVVNLEQYQRDVLAVCKKLWAQFDIPSMIAGVGVLAVVLSILIIFSRGMEADVTELAPVLLKSSSIGLIAGAVVGVGIGVSPLSVPISQGLPLLAAIGAILATLPSFSYLRRRLRNPLPSSIFGWFSVLVTVAISAGFAANSFTIWEDRIVLFFSQSITILLLVASLRQSKSSDRELSICFITIVAASTRLVSLFRLCREEQNPYCSSNYYPPAGSSAHIWHAAIPFLIAFVLPGVIKQFYHSTQSYQQGAILWYGIGFRLALWLSALFWLLNIADDENWFGLHNRSWMKGAKVMIAQTALGIFVAVGYSAYTWSPPFLNIQTQLIEPPEPGENRPQSKQPPLLGILSADKTQRIAILGYENVFGTRVFPLLTIYAGATMLLSRPLGQASIALLLIQILCLYETLARTGLRSSGIGPTLLALLGTLHFFATGHQAVLSSIQWDAAFIPLRTLRYPWAPVFILLNTFGSFIITTIAAVAIPLWRSSPKQPGLLGAAVQSLGAYLAFFGTQTLATAAFAGWLRRHLMLYRVFSPRFLMAGVLLLVVDIVGILVGLGGLRWTWMSVGDVFGVTL